MNTAASLITSPQEPQVTASLSFSNLIWAWINDLRGFHITVSVEKIHLSNSGFDIIMRCRDKWASVSEEAFFYSTKQVWCNLCYTYKIASFAQHKPCTRSYLPPCCLFILLPLHLFPLCISHRELFLQASQLMLHMAVMQRTRSWCDFWHLSFIIRNRLGAAVSSEQVKQCGEKRTWEYDYICFH